MAFVASPALITFLDRKTMSELQRVDIHRDSVHIPQSAVDDNGLVFCWSNTDREWRKVSPIDAREGIGVGALSLQGPEEGEPAPEVPEPPARERAFGAMPKSKLRQLCIEHKVANSGADSKQSLVTKLVTAGVLPS